MFFEKAETKHDNDYDAAEIISKMTRFSVRPENNRSRRSGLGAGPRYVGIVDQDSLSNGFALQLQFWLH